MSEATRRIRTLTLPCLTVAALAGAVLLTRPAPALGQEDLDKATPKLAESAAHPVPDFDPDLGFEGLSLTLSDRFVREKLTRGQLTEPVSLRELTEGLYVRVGSGVRSFNNRSEYVCTAALVRNGRTVAVHTSRPFKLESGRTASAGKHCIPGDERTSGDQWYPVISSVFHGDQNEWYPVISSVFYGDPFGEAIPTLDGSAKAAAELGSVFGTWAAKTVQACCVDKHDALVMTVFPTDQRMLEGDPDRPLIVLLPRG